VSPVTDSGYSQRPLLPMRWALFSPTIVRLMLQPFRFGALERTWPTLGSIGFDPVSFAKIRDLIFHSA
jgi:hypothetical protein